MVRCLESGESRHPCTDVVLHQWPGIADEDRRLRWRAEHHVPEPWVGHLDSAPLLFLSSNPSLSNTRPPIAPSHDDVQPLEHPRSGSGIDHPALWQGLQAPRFAWSDEELVDRFTAAFDVWMPDGVRQILSADGATGHVVVFWRAVKKHAEDLLDRGVVPGVDYALTEVVHCKSRNEDGVANAAVSCVPMYLRSVLSLSPAALIVVLGSQARNGFRKEFGYPDAGLISRPLEIAGRERRIVFLAHPAARSKSKYPRRLTGRELIEAREWVTEHARSAKYSWGADDVVLTKRPRRRT
jgi:hypothetical protein